MEREAVCVSQWLPRWTKNHKSIRVKRKKYLAKEKSKKEEAKKGKLDWLKKLNIFKKSES